MAASMMGSIKGWTLVMNLHDGERCDGSVVPAPCCSRSTPGRVERRAFFVAADPAPTEEAKAKAEAEAVE